ncbi:MAG: 3-deoxy-manno-octulosonate cytidylyltransferase [Planctomycetes bacterium]|nr:3-deoxy-manno-octulosonate cytidylyltransferase [Planctomycetota bacterium]
MAVVIPARGESTRLPGKMLLADTGFPLVVHTAARARDAAELSGGVISSVLVATDSPEIAAAAEDHGFQAVMTSPSHRSGTDRIAEAASHIKEDLVLNLQGDEPEMPPDIILAVARSISSGTAPLVTAAFPLDPAGMSDPSTVKVVCNDLGDALYFSRAPIPFLRQDRSAEVLEPLGHFGIYAYTKELLAEYTAWPEGRLEYVEALEQLRFLEHGCRIHVVLINNRTRGVDTADDYSAFAARFRASGRKGP